jgi:hypothetical protein
LFAKLLTGFAKFPTHLPIFKPSGKGCPYSHLAIY